MSDENKDIMNETKCGHCGATKEQSKALVSLSNGTCLCDACAKDIVAFISEPAGDAQQPKAAPQKPSGRKTPTEIVAFLNEYVIGQQDAKETLAIAVYNHYKRLERSAGSDVEISKSNILMLGPTGTGKTLLAQSIARLLEVPFAIADATSMTAAGYVGEDVESCLHNLLQAADGDPEKAERGIVFIDEIDKIARAHAGPSITRDVSGEGVQQGLLKLIEGSKVNVQPAGGRRVSGNQTVTIDTSKILFICAGAFVSLLEELHGTNDKPAIGFTGQAAPEAKDLEVTPELLTKHGMIPEFVGRLPVITTLSALSKEDLMKILTEPKNAITRQMRELLAMDGAELAFEEGAIEALAAKAIELKTGARGARSILEKSLKEALFKTPDMEASTVTVGRDLKVAIAAAPGKMAA